MSLQILGEQFDIHGGGDDLVFPHHENERAQAEAAGHRFARHWLHSAMVTVGGDKMAKSLDNYTMLADALDAHGSRAFRLRVLQTQYRSPTELGADELDAASRALDGLDALFRRARAAGFDVSDELDDGAVEAFRDAMDDDFGTPAAVAVIFEAVRNANSAVDSDDAARAASLVATVKALAAVLGLELDDGAVDDADGAVDDADVDALVSERDAARRAGDFAAADRLRDELARQGVTLEDTPTGTIWHR
jgi:cysteinyl-tRNA synthetase